MRFVRDGLPRTTVPVVVGRAIEPNDPTGPPNADPIAGAQILDQPPGPGRLHNFLFTTSCNMTLSSDRSATSFFRRAFSSSSIFSRFISDGISPPYFWRHR